MNTILVPVDFSDISGAVLTQAAAAGHAFGAKLWLIHVALPEPEFIGHAPDTPVMRDQLAARYRKEHCDLQALAEGLRKDGLDATALLLQGPTVETILREARKLKAELLVMGSHGHGAIYRALVGSVSEGVLRGSSCPVLIIPAAAAKS